MLISIVFHLFLQDTRIMQELQQFIFCFKTFEQSTAFTSFAYRLFLWALYIFVPFNNGIKLKHKDKQKSIKFSSILNNKSLRLTVHNAEIVFWSNKSLLFLFPLCPDEALPRRSLCQDLSHENTMIPCNHLLMHNQESRTARHKK